MEEIKISTNIHMLYDSYNNTVIYRYENGGIFAEVPILEYSNPLFDISEYVKGENTDLPNIKRITYDPPTTVVFWNDNTKTISKCTDNDKFSKEYGVAMCFMKKIFGSRAEFLRQVEKGGIKKYQNKKNKINNKCRMCEYHDHPVSEADLPCYDCKDDKLSRWTPINWEDKD